MPQGWIFQLSERQHKELARRRSLKIALPYARHGPESESNWLELARDALPEVRSLIHAADLREIHIRVPKRRQGDLTHILGEIYRDLPPEGALLLRVIVLEVLVSLDPAAEIVLGPQWPKVAFRRDNPLQRYGRK